MPTGYPKNPKPMTEPLQPRKRRKARRKAVATDGNGNIAPHVTASSTPRAINDLVQQMSIQQLRAFVVTSLTSR